MIRQSVEQALDVLAGDERAGRIVDKDGLGRRSAELVQPRADRVDPLHPAVHKRDIAQVSERPTCEVPGVGRDHDDEALRSGRQQGFSRPHAATMMAEKRMAGFWNGRRSLSRMKLLSNKLLNLRHRALACASWPNKPQIG